MFKRLIIMAIILLKILPMQQKADGVYAQTGEEWGWSWGDLENGYEGPSSFDWTEIDTFLDTWMDLQQQEQFDWIAQMNQNLYDQISEMNDFWQDAYSSGDMSNEDYDAWGDWWDWINNNYDPFSNNSPSCANQVSFLEDPLKKYGFDNKTDATITWKSIKAGETDKVKVNITPISQYNTVYFNLPVLPSVISLNVFGNPLIQAPSANFDITVSAMPGVNKIYTEIDANCESVSGSNIDKLKIATYTEVTKTVAVRLVNSKSDPTISYAGYNSTDVTDSDIIDYLNNKTYNQGIVHWTVTRLPAMDVDFDLNHDFKIDDLSTASLSVEQNAIITSAKDDNYDENIFLVDNPAFLTGLGFTQLGQRYCFVYAKRNGILNPNTVNTIAHELGHGAYSFLHEPTDPSSIMYNSNTPTRLKFRKHHWDAMHP
jgi:hypothetical protein